MRYVRLAKDFRRYGRKPGLRIVGLAHAEIAWRIRRTDAAGALDVGQHPFFGWYTPATEMP